MPRPPTGISQTHCATVQQSSGTENSIHRELKATHDKVRTTRAAMSDASTKPSDCSAAQFFKNSVIDEEALYGSAKKCWKGVSHKYSAQAYELSIIENTVNLANRLKKGTYKPGKTHVVHIKYPKERTAVAISYKDRVYQRSLNDNALYPQMVRSFIYSNCACQKGKGTDEARDLLKAMLRRAFVKYGSNKFSILSCDVRKYYDSMSHKVTNDMFMSSCDDWTSSRVVETLEHQYLGESGYNPGSQMVQIAGISYLNSIDHFIKENLRAKLYIRYMDDFQIIGTEDELERYRTEIENKLNGISLSFHEKKTNISSAVKGVTFLGFHFSVTESGKVLMIRDRKRVKEIRRRMVRLSHKIARGDADRNALAVSYQCVRATIKKGDSAKLLKRMDDFYNQLETEIENARRPNINS